MDKSFIKYIAPPILSIAIFFTIIASSSIVAEKKKANELRLEAALIQSEQVKLNKITYLMGKFEPKEHEEFVLVAPQYTTLNKSEMYLRKETYDAFLEMEKAATLDKIELKIVSATRNFDYQKNLWNNKWQSFQEVEGVDRFKKILEYSAVPGASRHHWGTDIDINGVNPPYFKSDKGKKEYAWLVENASKFGFCQTYNEKSEARPNGYNEEKWHWSYLPLARVFTEEYKELITNEDIGGFAGDEYVTQEDILNNYVLSINPDCI